MARYDVERARHSFARDVVERRSDDLWRWRELLPLRDDEHRVSLGERSTPIVPLTRVGGDIGIWSLAIKDDSLLPTGSFKARGAAVGVSRAKELGVQAFALPTNGNAGGAW